MTIHISYPIAKKISVSSSDEHVILRLYIRFLIFLHF